MVSLDIERQSLSFTLVDSILKRNEHREARRKPALLDYMHRLRSTRLPYALRAVQGA